MGWYVHIINMLWLHTTSIFKWVLCDTHVKLHQRTNNTHKGIGLVQLIVHMLICKGVAPPNPNRPLLSVFITWATVHWTYFFIKRHYIMLDENSVFDFTVFVFSIEITPEYRFLNGALSISPLLFSYWNYWVWSHITGIMQQWI